MSRDFVRCVLLLTVVFGQPVQAAGQDKLPRTDLYGMPLPGGALQRLGVSALGEPGYSYGGVCYSPDGKLLATDTGLWDLPARRLVRKWAEEPRATDERLYGKWTRPLVAFFPNGRHLLTGGSQGPFVVREAATGANRVEMAGSRFPHYAQAVSADCTTLASVTVESEVRIWEVATGELLGRWRVPGKPEAVALSPDGKTLATGEEGGVIRLWETRLRRERGRLEGVHRARVSALAFAPDGRTLAAGDKDSRVALWDLTGRAAPRSWHVEPREEPGHRYGVQAVRFTPDGKTLGASGYRGYSILDLWDAASGKHRCQVVDYNHPLGFGFSPDGNTVATLGRRGVHFWDVPTGRMLPGKSHRATVDHLAFSPEGRTLTSVGWYGETIVWDAATGKAVHTLEPRWCLRLLSGDGRVVVAEDGKGSADIQDPTTGKNLRSLQTYPNRPWCLSADGKTLVALGGGGMAVWDLGTGRQRCRLDQDYSLGRHALSRDGKLLAVAEERWQWEPNAKPPESFSVTLWDTATGKPVRTFPVRSSWLLQMAFSPDGATLAVLTYNHVCLHAVATGEKRLQRPGEYHSLAFSADGRRLAVDTAAGLSVWDALSGKELCHVKTHPGRAYGLAFSHDGNRLAAGCEDTSILVWDLAHLTALKAGAKGDFDR